MLIMSSDCFAICLYQHYYLTLGLPEDVAELLACSAADTCRGPDDILAV